MAFGKSISEDKFDGFSAKSARSSFDMKKEPKGLSGKNLNGNGIFKKDRSKGGKLGKSSTTSESLSRLRAKGAA